VDLERTTYYFPLKEIIYPKEILTWKVLSDQMFIFQCSLFLPSTDRIRYMTFIPNQEMLSKNTLDLERGT